MDRIRFMQSIIRNDRSMKDDIVDFFDHEMFLYEIVGSVNNTTTVIEHKPKKISFQIDASEDDIYNITNRISNVNKVVEYDIPLGVSYSIISNKSIQIDIKTE